MEALKGEVVVDGNSMKLTYTRPKDHPDSRLGRQLRTVYIGNLSWRLEEWQIEDFFSDCGEIDRINLPQNEDGRQRGFGFVQFKDKNAIDTALEK